MLICGDEKTKIVSYSVRLCAINYTKIENSFIAWVFYIRSYNGYRQNEKACLNLFFNTSLFTSNQSFSSLNFESIERAVVY